MNPTPNPTDQTRAELSALLDGELAAQPARFLLRRLANDPALTTATERWALAGDCLRGKPLRLMPAGFAAGLRRAIAAEPEPARARRPHPRGGAGRWAGFLALAASVALAVLLFASPDRVGPPASPILAEQAQAPAGLRERDLAPAPTRAARPASATALPDAEFEAYLVRHNEALRQSGLQGFVPFVDLVATPRAETAVHRVAVPETAE